MRAGTRSSAPGRRRHVGAPIDDGEADRCAERERIHPRYELDPSRQPFVAAGCGTTGTATFTQRPKVFLDACVSKERPCWCLTSPATFAYANDKAFAAVCGGQPRGVRSPTR